MQTCGQSGLERSGSSGTEEELLLTLLVLQLAGESDTRFRLFSPNFFLKAQNPADASPICEDPWISRVSCSEEGKSAPAQFVAGVAAVGNRPSS